MDGGWHDHPSLCVAPPDADASPCATSRARGTRPPSDESATDMAGGLASITAPLVSPSVASAVANPSPPLISPSNIAAVNAAVAANRVQDLAAKYDGYNAPAGGIKCPIDGCNHDPFPDRRHLAEHCAAAHPSSADTDDALADHAFHRCDICSGVFCVLPRPPRMGTQAG